LDAGQRRRRMTRLEDRVKEAVNDIVDPETGMTFGEMRLISDLREKESGVVTIDFKPTSPFCAIALKLALDIKSTAYKIEGVKKVFVYCRHHVMEETINKIVN
jgi:metal-sulfur cluster biosynthetic enzyme